MYDVSDFIDPAQVDHPILRGPYFRLAGRPLGLASRISLSTDTTSNLSNRKPLKQHESAIV